MAVRTGPGRRNTGRKALRGASDQAQEAPRPAPVKREAESQTLDDDADEPSAYNALLTLLKSDQPNKKARTSTKIELSGVKDVDEDQVEGAVEPDEAEEGEDDGEGQEDEIAIDDDNEGDVKDPFEWHFSNPDMDSIAAAKQATSSKSVKLPSSLGSRSVELRPDIPDNALVRSQPLKVKSFKSLKIKYRLETPFLREVPELTPLQREFSGPLFAYQDILFPGETPENHAQLQQMYTLHAVNHVYKTRDRILKNNSKLAAAAGNSTVEYRDQGFTRPKVLVLLPTRNAAYNFITQLTSISGLAQSENRKRFKDAFFEDTQPPSAKPKDFIHLFSGNTNDMFCLGIKFTRQALKLYSSFYSSDLIVASPLGLRMIVGNKGDRKRDYDFLSSIELAIVDQADAMQMQSWENVSHIFKHMNLIPREAHDCDFSRVRNWYLEEDAKRLRQTVVLSQYATPEMNHTLSKLSCNVAGLVKARAEYPGTVGGIGMRIRQVFTRIEVSSPVEDPDVRFKNFTTVILPALQRSSSMEGTLVFIPSYMDFVRVRNYLDAQNLSTACISEYSSGSEVSRARAYFAAGRIKMLVYTERLHHFRRYEIKGAHHIIVYSPPTNAKFYQEAARFLVRTSVEAQVSSEMLHMRTIYSKWDSPSLERIVGTKSVGSLVQGHNDTYEFY